MDAEVDGHPLRRRMREADAVESEALAGLGEGLPVEETPHAMRGLTERAQDRGRLEAHLSDPVRRPVAKAGHEAAPERPGESGQLHGRDRGVPRHGGHDAEAHRDPGGGGEGDGAGGHAAELEVVLGQPELAVAEALGFHGDARQLRRWGAARDLDADAARGSRGSRSRGSRSRDSRLRGSRSRGCRSRAAGWRRRGGHRPGSGAYLAVSSEATHSANPAGTWGPLTLYMPVTWPPLASTARESWVSVEPTASL